MNVSALKTPGVYINEINAFPPSVAQVPTVPAFIGYTQNSVDTVIKINSFLEFENIFGGAPSPTNIVVELDDFNNPTANTTLEASIFKLYNSLQLFYANGGGVCYIASIGTYTDDSGQIRNFDVADFLSGLQKLSKIDEPSIDRKSNTSELQSRENLVCRLLLEKKNKH